MDNEKEIGNTFFIEEDYHAFEDLLPEKHKWEVEEQGFSVVDSDGDLVASLVNDRQCVYSYCGSPGILKCAIEKAYFDGKSKFRKPVSCQLFPIRITEYKRFDAVNYQELDICCPGRERGASMQMPLYSFLKEPLIRKYGKEWYEQVEIAADHLCKKS